MSLVATLVGSLALAGPTAGYQTSRDSSPSHQPYSGVSSTDPDMAPLLVGILVLTGLAILFPSYINLTTVRRKRSAAGVQGKRSAVDRLVFQPWYRPSPSPPWRPAWLPRTCPPSIPTPSIRETVAPTLTLPPPHPTGPRSLPTELQSPLTGPRSLPTQLLVPPTRHLLLPTASQGICLKSTGEETAESTFLMMIPKYRLTSRHKHFHLFHLILYCNSWRQFRVIRFVFILHIKALSLLSSWRFK